MEPGFYAGFIEGMRALKSPRLVRRKNHAGWGRSRPGTPGVGWGLRI